MTAAALAQAMPVSPPSPTALIATDPVAMAKAYGAIAATKPTDFECRYWLYSALMAAGQPVAAREAMDEARDHHAVTVMRDLGVNLAAVQGDRAYAAQVGLQLYGANLMGSAAVALRAALDIDRLEAKLLLGYGLALHHDGRTAEAIQIFTAAAQAFPTPEVHGYLIYALFHAPDRIQRVYEEARRFADLYAAPLTPASPVFANIRDADRPLRIGYIAPTFTNNQLARFILPVLEAHDPSAVEVLLYCDNPAAEGPLPAWLRTRAVSGTPHDKVADLVREDGVDVLVDLWGPVAGGRLPVFAHRPAPVQLAWLNFMQTTGLACMDYVIHADNIGIEDYAPYFTETIWRIGPTGGLYRPAVEELEPVSTPALRNGYVTFGSFNNPAKLSEETVRAWAMILRERPADRLVLKYSYFVDPVLQRATAARFAAYGAAPEQLEFRGHTTGAGYLREFQDIDLALDPSPCPGGTSSLEALSNGVPVLTLRGEDYYARIGVSAVLPCGLSELVTDSWDDYVARALDLTADFHALDALRARVRPGFDASLFRDEAGFTRTREEAFRQMFARWMERSA